MQAQASEIGRFFSGMLNTTRHSAMVHVSDLKKKNYHSFSPVTTTIPVTVNWNRVGSVGLFYFCTQKHRENYLKD